MKQVLQSLANGETSLIDIPCPQLKAGQLLISTTNTLVSVGTERMLIDFGKSSFIEKARSQPDKVKMVLDKVKTDGLKPTIESVKSKLDQPIPLGYCNVGIVQNNGGTDFKIGMRVVSNGGHAEIVRVPRNLCCEIPDNVNDETASFTVLAAIALQGIRIANPTMGEAVVVVGLGLIGLITVQLLIANGCRVLGIDFDSSKCKLAEQFGAQVVDLSKGGDPLNSASQFSRNRGVDVVIITASTKSNDPISQAPQMCRARGRVVLVGVVGLNLNRDYFYKKEISFQVSCSYGAGRYDKEYEENGHDYPIAHVRWTEQRNFEAVLDLMSSGALNMEPLISHRFGIEDVINAYKCLDDKSSLGILLNYKAEAKVLLDNKVIKLADRVEYAAEDVVCGFIGGGNYASRTLMPAFTEAGAKLDTLLTSGGVSAVHQGNKNNFAVAATDINSIFDSKSINTCVIGTQHNLHAEQVIDSIKAGKNVFVEKPLALTHDEINDIEQAYNDQNGKSRVMVGFNRRFAPNIVKMKELLAPISEPKSFIFMMNAGAIPSDHWVHDPKIGGGRIVGEACHYIDLMQFLCGSKVVSFTATCMGVAPGVEIREDKAVISLNFEDGSFGTIFYLANGGKSFPKERIEVFANNGVLQVDNFKKLTGYGWSGFKTQKLRSQDKGQNQCIAAFVDSIKNGSEAPIAFSEIIDIARLSIDISNELKQ